MSRTPLERYQDGCYITQETTHCIVCASAAKKLTLRINQSSILNYDIQKSNHQNEIEKHWTNVLPDEK